MGLRIQNNIEAFNAHRQLTATAIEAAQVDGEALSSATASTARPTTPPASPSPRRCAVRSVASLRRSATPRTASRSSRRRKAALNEVHSMLQRVRDLKVQYDNGTLSHVRQGRDRRRGRADRSRRSRDIAAPTEFNGIKLLDGSAGTFTFQVGANDGETITSPPTSPTLGTRLELADVGDDRRRRTPCAISRTIDAAIKNVSHVRSDVRRGAEPPRAPPEQPGDLPGEPDRVREPHPRRGHGPEMIKFTQAEQSCSRPARACSRRPTRRRRASCRCCAARQGTPRVL